MKQWSDLHFILRKSDNTTLELGKEKYPIVKDNSLFDSLLTFEAIEEGRKIPIEVYINNISDTYEFQNFFEASRYNQNHKYILETHCNGIKYNSTVTTNEKPYEVTKIEDLYGTETQPASSIKIELIMNDPFFYSDFSYYFEIGAGESPHIRYLLPFRIGDNDVKYSVSKSINLMPHIIDNKGNEDNGVVITIQSGKCLVNPKISNETTNLSMGFNLETGLHDIIKIDTIAKEVYLNDILQLNKKNLFDKWLLLIKGVNILKFDADSGADLAKVRVQFYNKYRAIGIPK